MEKENEALTRAKNQEKIDKIASDLVLFTNTIAKYRAIFEEDGCIDSKEQLGLDNMDQMILKIRNNLTNLGQDSDAKDSNLDDEVEVGIEVLISKMQNLIESTGV